MAQVQTAKQPMAPLGRDAEKNIDIDNTIKVRQSSLSLSQQDDFSTRKDSRNHTTNQGLTQKPHTLWEQQETNK